MVKKMNLLIDHTYSIFKIISVLFIKWFKNMSQSTELFTEENNLTQTFTAYSHSQILKTYVDITDGRHVKKFCL